MRARPYIASAERRARLVARHHLARTAADPETVVRAVAALHASDPATPFLAVRARVPGFTVRQLETALYEARTLWRLHAMRRTLFVVPTEDAPIFDAAAARDVAVRERRRLEGWLAAELPAGQVARWLADVEARVLAALADGAARRTQELAALVPELAQPVTLGSGRWTQRAPVGTRILSVLAMEGRIARGGPVGSWRGSQYRWMAAEAFTGRPGPYGVAAPLDPAEARAALLRRYLAAHGPATGVDVRWWTGWTARQTAAALEAVGAVAVGLDGDGQGGGLPADVDGAPPDAGARAAAGGPGGPPEPRVALLPGLDSTPMGWKERDWFLDGHGAALFDRNGNVGPTVWLDGRVVGGWAQRPDGAVVWRLLEDVGSEAAAGVAAEAQALTGWLAGVSVLPRFPTPLERELSARSTGAGTQASAEADDG